MIRSFADKDTEKIFHRVRVRKLSGSLQRLALRKLVMVDAAEALVDLKNPPGNRLEKLSGSRKGQFSIRINDQWRVCFVWRNGHAHNVQIVDYH
ncbi:MAG: type II toxin-antitoxin system RelE/ParE family toxin [Candidatus Krumholzibacteriota bacterium]|nr:type II toxin-antitoxin system RelE/ParE family toxin [Candidatus Krumholzibacteriota bacterium]